MVHKKRKFSIKEVATAEELAHKLTEHSWCLCNGFRLGDYLYVNDAFSEDGAQEFAVFTCATGDNSADITWYQVESVTFGWCSYDEALEIIQRCQAGEFDECNYGELHPIQIEDCTEHKRCHLCA